VIDGSEIRAVESGVDTSSRRVIDVSGRQILPGFVDLHGDDIERYLEPKPEAVVDPSVALVTSDRLSLTAGVTTKFHALAFEASPEATRSIRRAETLVDRIETENHLLADHRVHARCEVGDATAFEAVSDAIARPVVDLVSIMNHLPGDGQHADLAEVTRDYQGDFWREDEVQSVIQTRESALIPAVQDRIDTLTELAGRTEIPVAAHDTATPDLVDRVADLGVSIAEYPTALSAARQATRHGLTVAMGAPNLVRGGSLWGNLSTRRALDSGTVDILCSDFHPPSLLSALFIDTGEPIQRRVARLTCNPAEAVGFSDRGRLEVGHRADVLVVKPGDPPLIERVLVGGSEVFRAGSTTS
jgi:alpha-D-ribose 1-methylphosphonate 5-triphosphate diphosphatase